MDQHRLTMTFRIETPIFMSGAFEKEAELRVSSVKGLLRYWYRAVQNDLTEEAKVFGSMDHGQSAVQLRLHRKDQLKIATLKPNDRRSRIHSYLAFSLKKRPYLQPSASFEMEAIMLPDYHQYWRDFLASVWLLTTIGGIGARSRRGFGSLTWVGCDQFPESAKEVVESLPKLSTAKTWDQWLDHFQKGVQILWNWFPPEEEATRTILHPDMKLLYDDRGYPTWNEALSIGGNVLQWFRKNHRKQKEIAYSLGTAEKGERYPSPVWLRIVRVEDAYYPVYFFMKTSLPDDVKPDFIERFAIFLKKKNFHSRCVSR